MNLTLLHFPPQSPFFFFYFSASLHLDINCQIHFMFFQQHGFEPLHWVVKFLQLHVWVLHPRFSVQMTELPIIL